VSTPPPPEALIWSSDMATMVFMVRYGIWLRRERENEDIKRRRPSLNVVINLI
jgi:hypothetical protein